jgi:hypothetical protein
MQHPICDSNLNSRPHTHDHRRIRRRCSPASTRKVLGPMSPTWAAMGESQPRQTIRPAGPKSASAISRALKK